MSKHGTQFLVRIRITAAVGIAKQRSKNSTMANAQQGRESSDSVRICTFS